MYIYFEDIISIIISETLYKLLTGSRPFTQQLCKDKTIVYKNITIVVHHDIMYVQFQSFITSCVSQIKTVAGDALRHVCA